MAAAAAALGAEYGGRTSVRVVVIGDQGTGKSSLIVDAATDSFPESPPRVMPPTRLPADYFPDRVPITIIDTSSSPENRGKLIGQCQAADAIVLTYACDRPATLDRLTTYWLPELRRLEVQVPVIVVGCKLDLRGEHQMSLEQVMLPIMQQFREIETCIECSALKQIQVPEVFYYAQKAVLHPTAPLFNQETQSLRPRCVRAFKRIFILCDNDRDGALSDAELNDFQVKCFNAPLQPAEILDVKEVVQEKMPEGVNEDGLTLTGFLFLHALFIEKGRLETTWTVLRKFGYDNDLKLREDQLPISFKRAPDQSVELTNEAVEFLKGLFFSFDVDNDGALQPAELDNLFSTAPECPWSVEGPFKDAAEKNVLGGLTLAGFLSEWSLMTLLDPTSSLANLIYLGYTGDPAAAFHITRKRRQDRKRKQSQRNVYQCYVFGPKNAGKSALLSSFIGSSDENSWKRAKELLVRVATHGENSGFEIPCLIISAKDDLEPYPSAIQDSTRVSQDMGIETPIPLSMKLRDFNYVFRRIVSAAQQPHLSIPETEAGKNRKQYRRLVNHSLMFISVGAAAAVVGVAAYRVYSARKNTST
ncbi:mitochondrial Rho GTPase 1-like isoform X2 [Ananas comosus]|uniref:Mitochondrial Rho GTPase n=1 Tax=Ananas comosus TaxID=4615 RepID=A0A6P5G8Z8_ANACO|nr:mitochondrial Rho GTPase 1-like isoform X2 [Ananas comosus]